MKQVDKRTWLNKAMVQEENATHIDYRNFSSLSPISLCELRTDICKNGLGYAQFFLTWVMGQLFFL